jgi:hypothetical protein
MCGLCSNVKEGLRLSAKTAVNSHVKSCTRQHSIIHLFLDHKVVSVKEGIELKCRKPKCGLCSSEEGLKLSVKVACYIYLQKLCRAALLYEDFCSTKS